MKLASIMVLTALVAWLAFVPKPHPARDCAGVCK